MNKIVKIEDTTGFYLFYTIKNCNHKLKDIHEKLYQGRLKGYKPNWLNEVEFMPHITIGKFENADDLNKAYEDVKNANAEFATVVEKISVEIIDENEDSIIEIEVKLEL